jgi:hypothetical protein
MIDLFCQQQHYSLDQNAQKANSSFAKNHIYHLDHHVLSINWGFANNFNEDYHPKN